MLLSHMLLHYIIRSYAIGSYRENTPFLISKVRQRFTRLGAILHLTDNGCTEVYQIKYYVGYRLYGILLFPSKTKPKPTSVATWVSCHMVILAQNNPIDVIFIPLFKNMSCYYRDSRNIDVNMCKLLSIQSCPNIQQ